MFYRELIKKTNYQSIEDPIEKQIEKPIEEPIEKPKMWITTKKSAPTPYKFAPSCRCVFCMSIMHKSPKCPRLNKNNK
jgi:hypothetical protein